MDIPYYVWSIIVILLATTDIVGSASGPCFGTGTTYTDTYKIVFVHGESPPAAMPTNCSELKYNLPVNRVHSFPIKAQLQHADGTVVTSGPEAKAKFAIVSMDAAYSSAVTTYNDSWVESGGRICQWGDALKSIFPGSIQRQFFRIVCSSIESGGNILSGYTTDVGEMAVDGIKHYHPNSTVPGNNRVYRFIATLSDGSQVCGESNEFEVTDEAKELQIQTQPPSTVVAQQTFTLDVRVIGHDNNVLTSGADSCSFVDLSMPYMKDVMTFWGFAKKANMLNYEKLRLRGAAKMWAGNRHWAIRQQLSNGIASFNNITILDVTDGVKLNATCVMTTFPWSRRPDDYDDLKGLIDEYMPEQYYYMNMSYPISKAVALTTPVAVTQQTATQLVILNKGNIKPRQAASFLIPDIVVELQDADGKRIYSGDDANLNINIVVSPASACLSVDASFKTVEGRGQFTGSICEPIAAVTITFSATSAISGSETSSDATPSLEILNEIHLAGFQSTDFSAGGTNLGPHLEAFGRFAVEDINDGFHNSEVPYLTDRQIVMHSYDHEGSALNIMSKYEDLKQIGKEDPSKKIQGFVGFSNSEISMKVQPTLTLDMIPQVAVREDMYDFGDKEVYPYYNRVTWDQGSTSSSIMIFFKERKWTKICIVRGSDVEVSQIFYSKAAAFGIELIEVSVSLVPDEHFDTDGYLNETMEEIKASKTVIIWLFVNPPLSFKFIREAWLAGISPIQGYQWIAVGTYGWSLPFDNEHDVCRTEPICSVILSGAILLGYNYNLNGLRTKWWRNALSKHIKKDFSIYPGTIPKHTLRMVTSEFCSTYDAVMLYGFALNSLIKDNKTISGPALSDEMKKVAFQGLTGYIEIDASGNRVGSILFVVNWKPQPPVLGTPAIRTAMITREIKYTSDTEQVEERLKIQWPLFYYPDFKGMVFSPYALPATKYMNRVKFNTTNGMKDMYENWIPIPGCLNTTKYPLPLCKNFSDFQNRPVILEQLAPAPFYCEKGCGGTNQEDDITQYSFGKCITMNECKCNPGYIGDNCEDMICLCRKGRCELPEICICDAGWTGETCSDAICINACDKGRCTSPDVCTCDSGYVGSTCSSSLAVIVTLPILCFILLVIAAVLFGRWFLKRQAFKAALANLDWKVSWEEEVQTGVGAISMVSTAGDELVSKKNFITWKSVRCYAQKFDCDTLDVNNLDLRMEVVQVKELRHNNVLHFIGACLEWPNVCILSEPCPKGSLEDVLANDNIKLSWDFKYSLLKDICRGMDYLHRSAIGSHGRLKSTNCLVDNRWTCKIAGFGFPTMRYLAARRERPDKEENASAERNLFWTAPEILRDVNHIDQVGKGTLAGDAYAFAIITSEVIMREEPYANELMNLSAEEVLLLVKDKDAPAAAKAKRLYYEGGGDTTKNFRPKLEESSLPSEYAAKNGLKKLVEQNWHSTPENRLSFRNSLEKLNEIHPIKGELIDNLINMLEAYSSNLEAIVMERTKELQVEKAKTEQLVSQMLPKKVVEDLKHGRTVEPESFECVTIFFSDLVGFTAIAKNSTPLQVVDLLNDLYTTFDSILDTYDVYKVETIGDAYMVVSGLPIRNGDLHAGEIATMSLDLLASMTHFKIRHMPGTCLQLRIGMHSGSCVSGVVGLKMPRYCLFGDTVNTASRMESSSMALRIHMSDKTANILFKLGGYHLDCRGEREVKGKGIMTTYWLEGKDGFTKELPGKEMAVSASQHEFK